MEKITTVGLDIAKHVFQVHGVDDDGAANVRRKLRRDDVVDFFKALPPCLIGIEACATGHHWARVLMALGHEVRLMPASYVKPYVKRQKMGWLPPSPDGIAMCQGRGVQRHEKERTANERSMIGVDLAKNVFQLHGATIDLNPQYWSVQNWSFPL